MTEGVGLIGTGGIAERHASAYAETDGIELVAIADVDASALAAFGDRWDVPVDRRFADHDSMLAAESLDAVAVCSPTWLHHRHTLDAARSAAAPAVVFCEKPVATSVADGREMVRVCEEGGVELVVDHTRRFHPDVERLRCLVREEDVLGEPISATVQWAGELLRNATHGLDVVLFLLGAAGEAVLGGSVLEPPTEFDDAGGVGLLRLAGGTHVSLDVTRSRKQPVRVTDLVGTAGRLWVDWWADEVRYWEVTDELVTERPEARESLYGDLVERDLDGVGAFASDSVTSFRHAAEHVRQLVRGETENRSPGREAVDVLELLIGIYVSAATGGRADLPLEGPMADVTVDLA